VLVLRERGGVLGVGVSAMGLRAVLSLLLFWLATGLRTAFAFPVDMRATWVFPMNMAAGEVEWTRSARAGQVWLLVAEIVLVAIVAGMLVTAGLGWWPVLLQTLCGLMVSLLLAAALFVGRTQIPFTRPRLPGRVALPAVMLTYMAIFPALVLGSVEFEMAAERRGAIFLWAVPVVSVGLVLLRGVDLLACNGVKDGFPEDEEDDGPITLGLSG
jgi:hypothetical protein